MWTKSAQLTLMWTQQMLASALPTCWLLSHFIQLPAHHLRFGADRERSLPSGHSCSSSTRGMLLNWLTRCIFSSRVSAAPDDLSGQPPPADSDEIVQSLKAAPSKEVCEILMDEEDRCALAFPGRK